MYTFNKMWGVVTPEEAQAKIEEQKKAANITEPKNLEEQAISLVGKDIYEIEKTLNILLEKNIITKEVYNNDTYFKKA